MRCPFKPQGKQTNGVSIVITPEITLTSHFASQIHLVFNLFQRLCYGIPDITSLNSPKQAKASRSFRNWLDSISARSLFLESKREIRGFAFLKKMST